MLHTTYTWRFHSPLHNLLRASAFISIRKYDACPLRQHGNLAVGFILPLWSTEVDRIIPECRSRCCRRTKSSTHQHKMASAVVNQLLRRRFDGAATKSRVREPDECERLSGVRHHSCRDSELPGGRGVVDGNQIILCNSLKVRLSSTDNAA